MALLEAIGHGLVAELRQRSLKSFPHGTLAVHVSSWTQEGPFIFELWPCAMNSRAEWGPGSLAPDTPLEAHVVYAEVRASHRTPTHGKKNYTTLQSFPSTAIIDGLIDFGTPSGGRFWGTGPEEFVRAPGLLLPAPGIAHAWPYVAGVPNVDITVEYVIMGPGIHTHVEVLLASRFCDMSKAFYAYRDHNVALLTLPPPPAWSEGKLFGDAKANKPRSRLTRKRHTHRDSPV
jgi:hypothetical protein